MMHVVLILNLIIVECSLTVFCLGTGIISGRWQGGGDGQRHGCLQPAAPA